MKKLDASGVRMVVIAMLLAMIIFDYTNEQPWGPSLLAGMAALGVVLGVVNFIWMVIKDRKHHTEEK